MTNLFSYSVCRLEPNKQTKKNEFKLEIEGFRLIQYLLTMRKVTKSPLNFLKNKIDSYLSGVV